MIGYGRANLSEDALEELKPTRILVVEDEKVTQLVISNLLKREGFNVLSAAEGAEALRVLKAEKVDLILSDIHMPVMDGFTFFERVQEDPRLHQIPFVFLTSLTGQEHLMLGKELGADDYLTKPIDRDVLLASIRGKLKRAERAQASRTEEMEDLKEQVIKLFSDEVNAPSKVVTDLSALLRDQKISITSDHVTNLLQSIEAGGDRLRRGLDDFVMSLHIESGSAYSQYESGKSPHEFSSILSDIVTRSGSYAKPKNVQILWNPTEAIPAIFADQKHLEHVFERLVYSAVALSNPSTSVEISAEVGNHQVTLEIKDGGTGLGEDDVMHIFDKFPSTQTPGPDQYPLGLGLHTAKRLAEINKCDLTCLSQPGKGTIFTLTVPLS